MQLCREREREGLHLCRIQNAYMRSKQICALRSGFDSFARTGPTKFCSVGATQRPCSWAAQLRGGSDEEKYNLMTTTAADGCNCQ